MKDIGYILAIVLAVFLVQTCESGKGFKHHVTEFWDGTTSSADLKQSTDGEW